MIKGLPHLWLGVFSEHDCLGLLLNSELSSSQYKQTLFLLSNDVLKIDDS